MAVLTQTVRFNRVTQLNGIQWRYDIHGRTVEKDNGQTRWRYRYDGEHRLADVISQPRDRNKPQVEVSFRYDPLGRRIARPVVSRWRASKPVKRSPHASSGKGSGCYRKSMTRCR